MRTYADRRQYNISAVTKRRKALRQKALDYKGHKCSVCSYDKCDAALEFHHTDPKEKDFTVSSGSTRSWDRIQAELDKCILVCANCHREIHSDLAIKANAPRC